MLRAGALHELCASLDAHLFDASIGYLLADVCNATPLARAFPCAGAPPLGLKLLNACLAALGVGSAGYLEKRGFPMEPEALRPRLRLTPGGGAAVIFLTRRWRYYWMLIAERTPVLIIYS